MRDTPEDVLERWREGLPDGAFLTAAVVIVTYVVPGEDDADERGPFLAWSCDAEAGRWVHLGMVETAANDMRTDLRMRDEED